VAFRPPVLLVAAALQAGLLVFLAQGTQPVAIGAHQAAAFEGKGDVRLGGAIVDLRPAGDKTRMVLEGGGMAVEAIVTGELHLPRGAWVEATGRIARLGGALVLFVSGPDAVAVAVPAGVAKPSWADLAQHPAAWRGHAIEVEGTVGQGSLRDGDGHRVRLGDGPWPKSGVVRATAILHYDAACLCETLIASEVVPMAPPWTP